MQCPAGVQPFRDDDEGRPCPLFVPAAMLEAARRNFKGIWVEPAPGTPPHGRAYRVRDMEQGA